MRTGPLHSTAELDRGRARDVAKLVLTPQVGASSGFPVVDDSTVLGAQDQNARRAATPVWSVYPHEQLSL
jgi:hypothetical protein